MAADEDQEAERRQRQVADLKNRFDFHPATKQTGVVHQQVRDVYFQVALQMFLLLPDGREKSVVITKLEEAMFWSNAAIARASTD